MGIQFNQIDGLKDTFDSVSGDLQGQIDALDVQDVASGEFVFSGEKVFLGNVTFSGDQGLGIYKSSFYNKGYSFIESGVNIGGGINEVRSSTGPSDGKLHVTGGVSYFDDQVNVRNSAGVVIDDGAITGGSGEFFQATGTYLNYSTGDFLELKVKGSTIPTADTTYSAGEGLKLVGTEFFTSGTGTFYDVAATNSIETLLVNTHDILASGATISGDPTGILRLSNLPDHTQTGDLPGGYPATSGIVYRSGNHLMII